MSAYALVPTPLLDIAYLEWNPAGSRTAVLLHGWPDSPECWTPVAASMAAEGYRVLCPALRGFGPTRFRHAATPRSGELAALGRDLLDFIDALALDRPTLVGHDWGARAAANACGLRPGVATQLILLSVGYGTNDPNQVLPLTQARNYWYHWYMATPRGAATVRDDRQAFARMMWDTWSPGAWYTPDDFNEAARAFDNPDWTDVVLHSYRHRWGTPRAIRPTRPTRPDSPPRPSWRCQPWCCTVAPTPATTPPRPKARSAFSAAVTNALCWTAWAISRSEKPHRPWPTPSCGSARRRTMPPCRAARHGMADNPSVSRRATRRIFVGA
ncbi:alpha/beta fold hydrolase [Achromobacter spanius]|uniref:alpha/beta fold hydrolase n=1 Tax=Achromobacter spanius TaxID=217203 RepID=UPI0036E094EE